MTQQQTITRNFPKKNAGIHEGLKYFDKKAKFVMRLFSDGPKEFDFLLKILRMGRDHYWRREIIKRSQAKTDDSPKTTLDIACGSSLLIFDFAKNTRKGNIVAVGITREMLTRAVELRKTQRFSADVALEPIQARTENIPLRSDLFDCATISLATRNVSSTKAMLNEMRRRVKQKGMVISKDFTWPNVRMFAPFYRIYIFSLPPALDLVILRHRNRIFSYLTHSIERSKSPEEIEKTL